MAINRTAFNALVDDDGTGTTGTPWEKARIAGVILDPVDAALAADVVAAAPWTDYAATLSSAQGVIFTYGGAYTRYQRSGQGGKTILMQFSIESLSFSFACTEFWISFPVISAAWAGNQMMSCPLFINGAYETGYVQAIQSNTSYALIGRNGGQNFPATGPQYIRGQLIYRAA